MDGANCFTTSACTLLSYILCHIQNAQVNHFSLLYNFPADMKIGVCYSHRGLDWHASHKKGRKKMQLFIAPHQQLRDSNPSISEDSEVL